MRVIDLTHVIEENMPVYPGTEPPSLKTANTCERDGFRETLITMYSHTGTHMDPPAHLFPGRPTLDQLPPEQFIGLALVVDCSGLGEGEPITMDLLRRYGEDADRADFLLFRTGWDARWGDASYFGDFPCIDDQVLDHVLAGGYKGIGFDVISVDPIADAALTRHKKLFREKNIVNIENLCSLDKCGPGLFHFSCFPLRIRDCDGSPVRAVAWFDE